MLVIINLLNYISLVYGLRNIKPEFYYFSQYILYLTMNCTYCGTKTQRNIRILYFESADKELQLRLCDDCIDELLSEGQIELAH